MNMLPVAPHLLRLVASAGLALGFPTLGLAQDSAATGAVAVTIFADHYVVGRHGFADLDAVEAWVQPMRPRAVRLDLCEPAATRRLLVAGYRFRNVYLEMRPLGAGHSVCGLDATVQAVRVGAAISQTTTSDEDDAINRYWQDMGP